MSRLTVAVPLVAPPVNPVPATTEVISPAFAGDHSIPVVVAELTVST